MYNKLKKILITTSDGIRKANKNHADKWIDIIT